MDRRSSGGRGGSDAWGGDGAVQYIAAVQAELICRKNFLPTIGAEGQTRLTPIVHLEVKSFAGGSDRYMGMLQTLEPQVGCSIGPIGLCLLRLERVREFEEGHV